MLVNIEAIKATRRKIDKYKLEERKVYFESTGHFPRPLLLDDSNHILDGYTSYVVAKKKGLKAVDCTYNVSSEDSQKIKVRTEFNCLNRRELKKIVYDRGGRVCAICGQPLSVNDFNIDHWKPINQGGTNELDNLRATHKSCNRLKNDFMSDDLFRIMITVLAYQSRQDEEIAKSMIFESIKLVMSMTARKIRSFVF